jgi:arylsulfatase A-like enzyme
MQTRGTRLLLLLVPLLLAPPVHARVVLVGLDGASWNVIDPMVAAGDLPNLAAIVREGVTAELETVEPVSSPVVWTSIATGRGPEVHGVTDFFSTANDVGAPTVFERLAAKGRRVGLYDYLMTWPPVPLPGGFVIPGWLRRDSRVTPADVWPRAGVDPWVNAYTPLKTNEDYRRNALEEIAKKAPRWNALFRAFDLEVGAVTFYAPDAMSHRFWHGAWPEAFSPELTARVTDEQRSALRDAMRGIDDALGEIRSGLSPEDTLVIVSDHGFRAREEPRDVWVSHLAESLPLIGLEPERDGFEILTEFGQLVVRVAPDRFDRADRVTTRLARLIESCRSEEGDGLYWAAEVLDVAPRPEGHERSTWNRLRQWGVRTVLEQVYDVTLDPESHAVILALPRAGVLAGLEPDAVVRVDGNKRPLRRVFSRQVFTGEHDPIAVFLAAGGPVAARAERDRISVLDVAPLLFYLAGSPVPDDLEGQVPTGLLEPAALQKHPVARMPAAGFPGVERLSVTGPASDPELIEKLRRLGYIE